VGVAAGIAAAFAPIAGFYLRLSFLLLCSISAFTPIMIAAATGALVSEIVLDETILLNFRQQQVLIIIKYHLYSLGILTGFMSVYYTDISENRALFSKT
jgi:CIC family chloride channel protein